jgi:hypothetical protein
MAMEQEMRIQNSGGETFGKNPVETHSRIWKIKPLCVIGKWRSRLVYCDIKSNENNTD